MVTVARPRYRSAVMVALDQLEGRLPGKPNEEIEPGRLMSDADGARAVKRLRDQPPLLKKAPPPPKKSNAGRKAAAREKAAKK